MNIFEQATRKKLRFDSDRGLLTVEQLWDLPLQHKSGFDLDTVARTVNTALKGVTEESFVKPAVSSVQTELETKLEVVKHIIAVKIKEAEDAKQAASRAAERARLTEALNQKNEQEILGLSKEEIQKRLDALG